MQNVSQLNEAFLSFTQASKSLETYYEKLNKKVQYLTDELERKNVQLNKAVRDVSESKDYLHAILQGIGEAMIVLDRDERITMINKAAEDLLCLRAEDVSGQMFHDIEFIIEDGHAGTELRINGKRFNVIISRSDVTDKDGAVRGYVVLIKDITRLKELEEQHKRNERLIAMGEMAAKIVHEIRSPLCSIELFSNMLAKDLEGTKHSDMSKGISTGIKSLNNILTNMLFFARPQKPAFRDTNLREVIEESVTMLVPLIDARGISVRMGIYDVNVNGDVELLKQVFMNLIVNAIHSMPGGGMLEIEIRDENGSLTADVRDQGEGIDPDIIEKIFDPFFSTKDKGTGLGLAIAHKIMQSHEGFISAHINKGKGSTFSVSFPGNNSSHNEDQNENLYEKAGAES